jgi:hypothetical protein
MRSARNHWRDQVITRFGERFARWDEAACQRQECVPASLSGFTRCTLSGYPCVTKPELQAPLDLSSAEIEEMCNHRRNTGPVKRRHCAAAPE